MPGVNEITTETFSMQRNFSPLLNLDLGKTHAEDEKRDAAFETARDYWKVHQQDSMGPDRVMSSALPEALMQGKMRLRMP